LLKAEANFFLRFSAPLGGIFRLHFFKLCHGKSNWVAIAGFEIILHANEEKDQEKSKLSRGLAHF
jgi:hypothetical protein